MYDLTPASEGSSPPAADRGPEIIFLGLCERAGYVREGNTNLFKWNVMGLKNFILSHIFPLQLSGWFVGFALSLAASSHRHRFRLTDPAGNEVGTIDLSTVEASLNDPDAVLKKDGPMLCLSQYGWIAAFVCLKDCQLVIAAPGVYHLRHVTHRGEEIVGELHFAVVDAAPLTQERIASIRSDPGATKAVRIELGCKVCPSKCRTYAALDRTQELEGEGWCWYRDLPDEFVCECGKTRMSLDTVRRNLHGLIRHRHTDATDLKFVPLYERSSLETIRSALSTLLESSPREELLQQFLQENPILFHQFPSHRLLSKPPILTSFVADFAIVTPQRELLLVELEKTTTKLMKQDGGVASDLSHVIRPSNELAPCR